MERMATQERNAHTHPGNILQGQKRRSKAEVQRSREAEAEQMRKAEHRKREGLERIAVLETEMAKTAIKANELPADLQVAKHHSTSDNVSVKVSQDKAKLQKNSHMGYRSERTGRRWQRNWPTLPTLPRYNLNPTRMWQTLGRLHSVLALVLALLM